MVRMGKIGQKKQRPRGIAPERPLSRQHAADGLNLFIPHPHVHFKCLYLKASKGPSVSFLWTAAKKTNDEPRLWSRLDSQMAESNGRTASCRLRNRATNRPHKSATAALSEVGTSAATAPRVFRERRGRLGYHTCKMRELHGVVEFDGKSLSCLKRQALLFDKLHLFDSVLLNLFGNLPRDHGVPKEVLTDLEFLQSRELVSRFSVGGSRPFFKNGQLCLTDDIDAKNIEETPYEDGVKELAASGCISANLFDALRSDQCARILSAHLEQVSNIDTAPICRVSPSEIAALFESSVRATTQVHTVLRVALAAFPVPDDTSAWQDIIDFKSALYDKQWSFRRFLSTLATKQQTEAEIRDDIDWLANEYKRFMEIHHIKADQSFVEVYVIATLEMIEELVRFRPSKAAKALLSIRKRKIDLIENESKAPGRECAYVFDARKRFGSAPGPDGKTDKH
jgi:hypothetical protein